MNTIAQLLRRSIRFATDSNLSYWLNRVHSDFGLTPKLEKGVTGGSFILRQVCNILEPIPKDLIKDCGLNSLLIRDLGENKPHYPNHGYYVGKLVALNADIFHSPDQPKDFFDNKGYFVSRPQQTLIHEMGHSYDACHGDLSLRPKWLKLSSWSEAYKKGLKRLVINDPGVPQVVGEWFYDPKAGFTRFYAKRNPWDDFADSFAFYVAGMKSKLPQNKKDYFDDLLKRYY